MCLRVKKWQKIYFEINSCLEFCGKLFKLFASTYHKRNKKNIVKTKYGWTNIIFFYKFPVSGREWNERIIRSLEQMRNYEFFNSFNRLKKIAHLCPIFVWSEHAGLRLIQTKHFHCIFVFNWIVLFIAEHFPSGLVTTAEENKNSE